MNTKDLIEEKREELENLLRSYRVRIEQQRTPGEPGADSATVTVSNEVVSALTQVAEAAKKEERERIADVGSRFKATNRSTQKWSDDYHHGINDILASLKETNDTNQ